MTKSRPSAWLTLFLMLGLAPLALAQQRPSTPQAPGRDPVRQAQDPLNLTPTWAVWPTTSGFRGFPVFPSALQGYGGYPVAPGAAGGAAGTAPGNPFGMLFGGRTPPPMLELLPRRPPLPAAEPEMGWPGWARLRRREPLPYAEDLALLVRHSERVWWRAASDEPHVPLAFHDKLRTLKAGAGVEVRQAGDFELVLHDGSSLVSRGPSSLTVDKLSADEVALQFTALTRVHLIGLRRAQNVVLPDGSSLLWGPPSPELEGEPVDVHVDRETGEPGWLGGRATITNYGRREVVWRHAFGEQTLKQNERLTLFLAPPATDIGADLVTRDVEVRRSAGTASCTAGAVPGEVRWSGASFVVAPGRTLRLEGLLGEPFAPKATPAAPATPVGP